MAHYPKIFDFTGGGGPGGSVSIDSCEIAWGTGNGITSSNYFVFDCSNINLIFGGTPSNKTYGYNNLGSIIGGVGNKLCGTTGSTIIGSSQSYINYARNSGIFSGQGNSILMYGSTPPYAPNPYQMAVNHVILGGELNRISYLSGPYYNPYNSAIISGKKNLIAVQSGESTIIGGQCNNMFGEGRLSVILGGCCNCVVYGNESIIQSSVCSCIGAGTPFSVSQRSSISSSYRSCICGTRESEIRSSEKSMIKGGVIRSSILSTEESCIQNLSERSTIISSKSSEINNSKGSSVLSSNDVDIFTSSYSGILFSKGGLEAYDVKNLECSCYSSIISGFRNLMFCGSYMSFLSSLQGQSLCTNSSSILASSESRLIRQKNSTIIASTRSDIFNQLEGRYNSIISAYKSGIYGNIFNSSVIGGRYNNIFDLFFTGLNNCVFSSSLILGGCCNRLYGNSTFSSDAILSSNKSCINYSSQSVIVAGSGSTITSSINSSIIAGTGSKIIGSTNSVIIGGKALNISNERDVVYVSTLKIDSVTQSIDNSKVLVWDSDKCVRYTTSVGGKSPIDICEVAWGTGDGITSSNYFLFDCSCINLVMGGNTPSNRVNTATNSVFLSSIIGGLDNCLLGLTASSIIGGSCNTIWRSCYSSELAGKLNTITQSNFATIINGSASCIVSSNYSTIIGGFSNTLKSAIRNSPSSLILNSTGCALIGTSSCSMIANALCSKIEESQGSLILGGSCDCIVDQSYRSLIFGYRNIIVNSKDSIVLGGRSNCICTISICSTIISGCENVILNNACDSIIIHGWNSCIKENSKNSIINSDSSIISASCFSEISSTTQSCICNSEFSSIQASSLGKSCDNCHSALISTRCSCIIGKSGTKDYTFDVILGGCCHTIATSSLSTIIGGYKNTINRGANCNVSMISSCCSFAQFNTRNSSIIGSEASCILVDTYNSSIIGGCDLLLRESKNSLLGFSTQSCTCQSNSSINIGGYNNRIDQNSNASTLMGSSCALIYCSKFSSIIGSRCSNIGNSDYSSVIGGYKSCICVGSLRSSIISSCDSKIITSTNSVIIGGTNSCICNSQNSAIIGGRGLTLSNENQVVYIPELKINKVDQCEILTKFLAWDDTNKYVRWGTPGLAQGITGSTPYYSGSFWTFSSTNIYNNGVYVGIGLTNSNNVTYATPSSNLHVFGSLSLDVKTASSNYTLTDKNFTLLAYSTSVGMTVSLPQASLAKNRVYVIKRVTTEGQVRINPFAGDNIEGYGSYITLDTQWDYNILQSDGAFMWIKLGGAVGLNLS